MHPSAEAIGLAPALAPRLAFAHRGGPLSRLRLVAGSLALGLLLALVPRAIYPFYAHAPRTWGPGPLADQQIAGVTMAAEEAIVFFGAFTAYLLRFLADEQASGSAPSPRGTAPATRARPVSLPAAPGSARPRH